METKKTQQSWIVLGAAALLLLGFFVYQYSNSLKQHDWRFNLEDESKEPYGTFVIKEVLAKDSLINLDKKVGESLPEETDGQSNFVFIGEALLLDSSDIESLLDFVDAGNVAFISSQSIPDLLMEEIYGIPCDSLFWVDYGVYYDTAIITNFVHPDLRAEADFIFPYVKDQQVKNTYWEKVDEIVFCAAENQPIIISQSPDSIVDMIKLPYGEGAFYLQTSPMAFTNYQLTKKQGRDYVEKAFSHLNDGTIYWDDFSNVPVAVGRRNNWDSYNPFQSKAGPLDYILSQPPLAWAWYLLVALGVLYLLFRAKRRQRTIPVLAPNRNTSLEFISTIGRLHFTGNNHRRIALQKMDLMESFIRSKYRLSAEKSDKDFTKDLSIAAEIDESIIKKMFLLSTNIKSSTLTTDKTLIELHKLTDYFYKNCR